MKNYIRWFAKGTLICGALMACILGFAWMVAYAWWLLLAIILPVCIVGMGKSWEEIDGP
jgi:hypothetical protein